MIGFFVPDWFIYSLAAVYFICQTHLFVVSIAQFLLLVHSVRLRSTVPTQTMVELPKVTVQLPVFNERYVVQELIQSVLQFNYPSHLLEIQILDDSTDDTTAIIESTIKNAGTDISIVHIKRDSRSGFKAGALKNGLLQASGEFYSNF